MIEYTIQSGDTLYSIARKFGLSPETLFLANPDVSMSALVIGQVIWLPHSQVVRDTIDVNGFTLPTISMQALADKLPFLSWISPLSYTIQSSGTLIYTDDSTVRRAASKAGVGAMMVVSNTDETGTYSGALIHDVLSSELAQQTLLAAIIANLQRKRYYGLIVDFQYIYPPDYGNYAQFIQAVSGSLRPLGYIVCATVRLSVVTQERARLNEALQYTDYRYFFNNYILMNNECPPADGSMQSLDLLQGAVEFSTSLFPSQMMLLGMPNCCYDWLMTSQADGMYRPLSVWEAGSLSNYSRKGIELDPSSHLPYFQYEDTDGNPHIVCPSSDETTYESLALVRGYSLGGASFWRIELCSLDCFIAIAVHFEIRKPLADI